MTRSQQTLYLCLIVLGVVVRIGNCTELTFELPDREEQCFYEEIEKDVNVIFEFQVCHFDSQVAYNVPYTAKGGYRLLVLINAQRPLTMFLKIRLNLNYK